MFKSIFNVEDFQGNVADKPYTMFRQLNNSDNVFIPWDGNSYDDATVRTCINTIAKHAAKLKPKHIRRQNGKIIETDSVIDSLLSTRPNEYMSTYDFIYKIVSQLALYNNAFVYIKSDSKGNIIGLYPLNYGDVELVELDAVLYCKFNFLSAGQMVIPYTDIIHIRDQFNREDFFGETNERPLKSPLKILNTVKQGLENAVKNCTKLRGILEVVGNLKPGDIEKINKNFVDSFLDTSNSTGIATIDQKSTFHQLTSDIQTADHSQMEFIRDDVYRYFGLNEAIIKGNYTEDQWAAFYESIIEPIAIKLSLEFTSKLFTEREKGHGNEVIFTANRLQYASMKSKTTMVQALLPQGIITLNEAREIFGFSAVDDGDKRQVSLNFVDSNKQNQYQLGQADPVATDNSEEGEEENA
jgi:HK97 family phage portal protein